MRGASGTSASVSATVLMADDLMLGDSGLSKLEREMIAVAVSSVNHCHYCLTAHGAAVRQRAKDPEMGELMAQNYRAADLPPRQAAMLDFAASGGLGFSTVVALGGAMDIGFGELLDVLLFDPHTDGILLYVESVGDARRFLSDVATP